MKLTLRVSFVYNFIFIMLHVLFTGAPNSNLPPSAQGRVITMLSDRLNNLNAAFKGECRL